MSGRYKGFLDILTGFLLGAGTLKIYYETLDTEDKHDSFIFRKNKQKIDEICTSHDNLKFGKGERVIKGNYRQFGLQELQDNLDIKDGEFQLGIPGRSPVVLHYKNHVLAYDYAKKIPLWVAEHLTAQKVSCDAGNKVRNAERAKSTFRPDPNIPDVFQSRNEDYFKSGWTRGHMAPAGDNKHDQESMNETFLLSNILPQNFENNANFWYRMEAFCRNLTKKFTDVYVISGPLWLPYEDGDKKFVKYEVIGENNIAVPTHLFKVILTIDDKNDISVGAFEVPNEPVPFERKLNDFQVPLTKLVKDSGFCFFKNINKSKMQDLCHVTGCKLMSKEFMDTIAMTRKVSNAKNMEELENIWKEMNNTKDSYAISVYQKKVKELENIHINNNEHNI